MTLLPQVREQLDEAAKRRAGGRRARLTLRIPGPGIRERPSLANSTRAARSSSAYGARSIARAVVLVTVAFVPVAIVVGALVLLRGATTPRPTTKPAGNTIQHLVDILAVLRRPQTNADRSLSDSVLGGPDIGLRIHTGTPDLPLSRLATVTPWGQKVFIAPMKPLTPPEITRLEHRYPGLARAFERRPAQTLTLGLFASGAASFGSVADIEAGKESVFDGANSILGLDGPAPPIRVVITIPDGVAKVTFVLPRQAYPGAIAYPAPETITVPVHDNVAAFETDRYIDQDHWSRIGMIWYGPSGAIVKRTGEFDQLNTVLPDPTLSTAGSGPWDSSTVVPSAGNQSTTFTAAFRRPVSGAYHYAFLFSGPTAHAGCYSPVSQTPIIRGPDLGIHSNHAGQIASTQFSGQTWCPGTYRISVAVAGNRPFSTTRFTVHP
jgi:hypothetical protein